MLWLESMEGLLKGTTKWVFFLVSADACNSWNKAVDNIHHFYLHKGFYSITVLSKLQSNVLCHVCSCLDTDMVIIYLSAGITSKDSSEDDKKATLRVINEENSFLNNSVMILTYALMNGKKFLLH